MCIKHTKKRRGSIFDMTGFNAGGFINFSCAELRTLGGKWWKIYLYTQKLVGYLDFSGSFPRLSPQKRKRSAHTRSAFLLFPLPVARTHRPRQPGGCAARLAGDQRRWRCPCRGLTPATWAGTPRFARRSRSPALGAGCAGAEGEQTPRTAPDFFRRWRKKSGVGGANAAEQIRPLKAP